MAKSTYRNILKFTPLRLHTELLQRVMSEYPIKLTHSVVDRSSLMGIEVEVENLPNAPSVVPFWKMDHDGSLRNNGIEYISLPLRGSQIEYGLRVLFQNLANHDYKFTPRCSVHIHMNARYMTREQLRNMMLIYLIFERMLFAFVGEDRENNIHCVPLLDADLTEKLFDVVELTNHPSVWMKYTALNLVTLGSIGTIEFRHMHGTDDIDKLMMWINMIQSMKLYAYKHDVVELRNEIFSLNTNSQYRQFAVNVFGSLASHLIDDSNYQYCFNMMEEGVTMAKLCSEAQNIRNSLDIQFDSRLGKLFRIKKPVKVKDFSTLVDWVSPLEITQVETATMWQDELQTHAVVADMPLPPSPLTGE